MLLVRAVGEDGWQEVDTQAGLVPLDQRLQLDLGGLDADSAYSVTFYDEDTGARSRPSRFRTALSSDAWRVVTVGATSCLGGNEPWATLTLAAEQRLDLFLLLGDLVYADGASSLEDYRLYYDQALRTEGFRDLCASTSLVATWDDHEVANNWDWSDLADGQFDAALQAFRETLPFVPGGGVSGIWRKLSWGAVLDVFVLDCRAERDGGIYISAQQQSWLLDGLANSGARFKIIMNSVPITDLAAIFGTGGASDRWDGYATQRQEVLATIRALEIPGILWVTGDVHYAQVGAIDPEGGDGEDMVEVFAGPGGSPKNVAAELFGGDPQYWWMSPAWNYVRFTCDPGTGRILVEHIDDDGLVISSFDLAL
jgi:alkaline phosphatase D